MQQHQQHKQQQQQQQQQLPFLKEEAKEALQIRHDMADIKRCHAFTNGHKCIPNLRLNRYAQSVIKCMYSRMSTTQSFTLKAKRNNETEKHLQHKRGKGSQKTNSKYTTCVSTRVRTPYFCSILISHIRNRSFVIFFWTGFADHSINLVARLVRI